MFCTIDMQKLGFASKKEGKSGKAHLIILDPKFDRGHHVHIVFQQLYLLDSYKSSMFFSYKPLDGIVGRQ